MTLSFPSPMTTDHYVEMSETEPRKTIYLGQQPLHQSRATTSGEEITISGETFYKITAVDRMRPFFMSIVSHSDHWMFISSTGGLTAGLKTLIGAWLATEKDK